MKAHQEGNDADVKRGGGGKKFHDHLTGSRGGEAIGIYGPRHGLM